MIKEKRKEKVNFLITIISLILTLNLFIPVVVKANDLKITPSNEPVILNHEKVVRTFEELRSALINDNGITTIYLDADIEMKIGGITVHQNKEDVIIDGKSPYTQTIHTLTDHNSSTQIYSIYINLTSKLSNITIKNMNIIGKNFYGPISVSDSKRGVTINYENITYVGPQITFNRHGMARYIDCNITINNSNGGSPTQEVGEVKDVELGGKVIINHQTPLTYYAFWIELESGTFRVLENADVSINVNSTGLLFTTAAINLDIIIENNAKINIATPKGLLYADQSIRNFTVDNNALFSLETTNSQTTYPVIRLTGNLNVNENSIFHVKSNRQTGELIEFTNNLATANFNNPKSVLLYSPNNVVFHWTINYGTLNINTNQLNYWTTPGGGGFNDIPRYSWNNDNLLTVNAKIATTGKINSITSNDATITSDKFDLSICRVLAFGNLKLTVDHIYDNSQTITGNSEPGASIKAEYDSTTLNGITNTQGNFILNVVQSLLDTQSVKVATNYYFLTKEIVVPILDKPEELIIDIPPTMNFETTKLSSQPRIINRSDPNWSIEITTSPQYNQQWSLYTTVIKPFITEDNETLTDALIFVDKNNVSHDLNSETLIATSYDSNNKISWNPNQGILVFVKPGEAYAKSYDAILQWNLVIAP